MDMDAWLLSMWIRASPRRDRIYMIVTGWGLFGLGWNLESVVCCRDGYERFVASHSKPDEVLPGDTPIKLEASDWDS